MIWNTTGDIVGGSIDSEQELCRRFILIQLQMKTSSHCICISYGKSRVNFNTLAPEWSKCMDTCSKYRRAMAPSFTDMDDLKDLLTWAYNTTTDPVTNILYPDGLGRAFWVPFRLRQYC